MRHARWLMAATAVVLALSGVSAMAQDAGDLDAVTSRLEEIAGEIDAAEAAADDAGTALDEATARLAEVEAIVNDLAVRLEQQQARVDAAQGELDRLRARSEEVQAAFEARTVELFKRSYGSDLDAVLSAGDIQEAMDRRTLLDQVNESDRATIEQVRAARGAVLTQQEVLQGEHDRLEEMKAEQEVVLEQVREIRRSKAVAAAAAEARVDELSEEHAHLEEEQERIEEIIAERQAAAATIAPPTASGSTSPTAASASGYQWPSCGSVTSEYGRRWGRMHEGLDIDDNRGSAIVAAKGGTVIFAGWSGGYGQMTLIDHHDGVVTAYAHQAAVMVGRGQTVSGGQRIGTIGTTGSSTGTHLHFETRVNGAARNPRQFLPGGC
jgi:murein DD-endopeptidase MepM/ murein hydrolase activator NlpD